MATTPTSSSSIEFSGLVEELNGRTIVRLPEAASSALPSRGQVAAEVVVADQEFVTVIEPDGMRGHWLNVGEELRAALGSEAGARPGIEVTVSLTPTKSWPETTIPEDFGAALDDAPELAEVWAGLTPMARWEWVRWISSTKNPDTRARRVEVAISKLESGKRRPCCFDLSSCTDPELSKSGKLLGIT